MHSHTARVKALASRRWRIALILTLGVVLTYFGFILLVAFDKGRMGTLVAPGLSLGMVLGSLVILLAWAFTGYYVYWANRHYDVEIVQLRREQEGQV